MSERDKLLYDLQTLEIKIDDTKERALKIVNDLCKGKLSDTKHLHEVYRITGMSTSMLRTIINTQDVFLVKDAIKIIRSKINHDYKL